MLDVMPFKNRLTTATVIPSFGNVSCQLKNYLFTLSLEGALRVLQYYDKGVLCLLKYNDY